MNKQEHYGVYGLLQESEVIPTEYEGIKKMQGGYRLKKGGKYGFGYSVKNKLKIILPIKYDKIEDMGSGLLRLTKNEKQGIFNIFSKKITISITYDKIERPYYSKSRFYLAHKNEKTTILSGYNFTSIIDKEFEHVKYKDGFLICLQNGQYYLYDATGYTFLKQVDDLVILNNTLIKVKKKGKWGIYSAVLKDFIIPCEHDKLHFDATKNIFKIGDENYKIIGKYLTSINSVFYECLFPLYSL